MKFRGLALAALASTQAWIACGGGARADEGQPRQLITGVARASNTTDASMTRLSTLTLELRLAQEKLNRAKAQYDNGTATAGAFEDARAEVARLELAVAEARDAAAKQEQVLRLLQPVTVQFQAASLKQAAESLSKAANLPIHVNGSAPDDARLNLTARSVPLRNVLEAVARNLNLRIDPSPDGGVELRNWPELEINGQKQVVADASPWSAAWGSSFFGAEPYIAQSRLSGQSTSRANGANASNLTLSGPLSQSTTANSINSGGQASNNSNTLANNSLAARASQGNQMAQFRYAPSGMLLGVNITSVNNVVVVAEPGRGPQGEPGAWLTVYSLDGVNLVKRSATFHATRATLVSPGDVTPQSNFFNQAPQNSRTGQTRSSNRTGR